MPYKITLIWKLMKKKNKNGKYLLKCTNFYANVELTK